MHQFKKYQNRLLVYFIFTLILFIYWVNVKLIWIDRHPENTFGKILYLILFHLSFVMLLWSLLTTMLTDPGKVPLYWGYFLDANESRNRRYCLICHIFKPERCHHCSQCGRCVLNMDHHCPWINNCVGFFNRKFFLLMLFYVILTAVLAFFGMIEQFFSIFFVQREFVEHWMSDLFIIVGFGLDVAAIIVIGLFFKFHVELVLKNSTTIENLDKKRSASATKLNTTTYNMGEYYNLLQVFGENYWIWPLPIFSEKGKPVGDGILWPKKQADSALLEKDREDQGNTADQSHQISTSQLGNNQGLNNTLGGVQGGTVNNTPAQFNQISTNRREPSENHSQSSFQPLQNNRTYSNNQYQSQSNKNYDQIQRSLGSPQRNDNVTNPYAFSNNSQINAGGVQNYHVPIHRGNNY